MGVKIPPNKTVDDFNPSIRVNLTNSVLRESPKFKNPGLPNFDVMGKQNIDFATSTRAKYLNGTRGDKFIADRLGYTHDFERASKKTAYINHIKNSELETREVFERETENIPLTRQTDLVTPEHENPLTRSTDSSKNEERHEPEVNPDP